ncbi:hypothetical protein F0L68_16100 [Solihabitans fulvus]|uniref:Lipoprotein n=1 Tax=Solihabitans fulvus TaxID=1892852 RepID=A0A5B2XEV5_9PSEU|nr:hypothetical protein [Solihabitans fulvus]KAA2261599.1 hypothetical protein F0L68_16100 [Solihabitans fulvus]
MRLRPLLLVAVATGVVTVTVAGCSSQTGTAAAGASSAASSPAPPSAGSATASVPVSPSPAASGSVAFTKQGTALTLGGKAIVPFTSTGHQGAIGVTVTGIDKGATADLAPLQLGAKVAGMVPYYVRVTVSNESGSDFSFVSLGLMHGLLASGDQAQQVSVIGKFDKCPGGTAGKDFTTKGATFTGCVLALSTADAPVVGADYSDGQYSKQAPDTDYARTPVTWN